MMKSLTGLVFAFAIVAPRAVAADCMQTEHTADLLTPEGAAIPADGGLLVGWKIVTQGAQDDDPAHPRWKFGVEMVAETLAPALVVHRPKTKGTGKLAVTDAKGAAVATFARDTKAPPVALPQPKIATLVFENEISFRAEERVVTATLLEPAPEAAIAIITYNKKHVALSYGRVGKGRPSKVIAFSDPGKCGFNPKGMAPPAVNDKVTFAWVDQFGRVSKPSAVAVVTAAKPAP